MYRKILLPLDGSPFSEAAVPIALSLARKTGAGIRLTAVLETFSTTLLYDWGEGALDHLRQYLESVGDVIQEELSGHVISQVTEGHVAHALEAQAEDVDLVVMATHGRGGLSRVWLGSVADSVVRHSSKPILLVRPGEEGVEGEPTGEWTPSRILLPLDGSQVSEAILDHAVDLASLYGSVLHLTRVVPPPLRFSSYPPHMMEENRERMEGATEEAEAYLRARGDTLRARGITVEETVVGGAQPVHGILAEADRSGCDLIAISAHSRGAISRAFLGSTSDKVVRGAHCPVLVFRRTA